MLQRVKWAWCYCTKCGQRHRDVVPLGNPDGSAIDSRLCTKAACMRCFTLIVGSAAAHAYFEHRIAIAGPEPHPEQ